MAMVQALQARDGTRLRQVLMEHLDNKRSIVIEQMRGAAQALHPEPADHDQGHAE
jgi:DNA-binding GntR family transcriptional regulator